MISFFIISLLIYCVTGSGVRISPSLFEEFKAKYRKSYSSVEEEKRRLMIFMSNMDKAEEMNRANPYAEFGITKFSDLTEEEFKSTYANGEKYYKAKQASKLSNKDMITYTKKEVASSCTAIDWRKKGAVTAVKDQGHCGSCWAFSTIGNIEGQWFLAGHPLVSLSEQELVSCDFYDNGCRGGLTVNAYKFLINSRKGQIVTESSLPYTSGGGNVSACPATLDKLTVGAQIKGYRVLEPDEDQMATFVCSSGPLSIAVDADSWDSYKKGILTYCPSKHLDHGVLIVGFDKSNNPPYWIIKNSWGADWGEDGYIRVAYGSNQCWINNAPTTSAIGIPPPNTTISPSQLTKKVCNDSECSKGCSVTPYLLEMCMYINEKASLIIYCSRTEAQFFYFNTTDCSGDSKLENLPVDKCLRDDELGVYYEVSCSYQSKTVLKVDS